MKCQDQIQIIGDLNNQINSIMNYYWDIDKLFYKLNNLNRFKCIMN